MTDQKTYGAKQVASRIGTHPKTLRKFLRSSSSPYEAVGQGGRYEFPVQDLAEIKKAFLKWQRNKRITTPTPSPNGHKPAPPPAKSEPEIVFIRDDDDWGEPTDQELAELEKEL